MEDIQNIKSAAKPGKVAIVVLAITIVYSLITSFIFFLFPVWLGSAFYDFYGENIIVISAVQQILYYSLTLAFLIYLFVWFARAYQYFRLTDTLSENKPTTTMAVLYWFIPILNLFKPYQLLSRVMRNLDTQLLFKGINQGKVFSDTKLIVWWLLFLYRFVFSYAVSYIFRQMLSSSLLKDERMQLIAASIYSIFSFAMTMMFLAFTIWMINSYRKAEKCC